MNKQPTDIWSKIIFFISLGAVMFPRCVNAQELVINGSFESYNSCPSTFDELDHAVGWNKATTDGSSDYLNGCSNPSSMGVPYNYWGYQQAHSGQAYAGIVTLLFEFPGETFQSPPPYREYLEGTLSAPLQAGTSYAFEMYVNVANNQQFTSSNLGVYFSNSPVLSPGHGVLSYTAHISNPRGNYPDTSSWKRISGIYKAAGGERYFTIGNFQSDALADTMRIKQGALWHDTYFFVDDVSLRPATKESVVERELDAALDLYPNPATETISVDVATSEPVRMLVTDVTGRVVLDEVTDNRFLTVSGLDPGFYYLHLEYRGQKTVAPFRKQ